LYFCITTITTVGYGDISGLSDIEKCFCILLMLVGVISFSFSTGSLSAVFSSYDIERKKMREDMKMLDEIDDQY
jgi:hypothetical protein